MMHPALYRTTYSKALQSYVNSGFFARDLDADDHAFLECVRVRGSANGTLESTNATSAEEFDFWNMPYAVAPGVERRSGPIPKRVESAEELALRKVRSLAWHARRKLREQEKAIAAAELERERREWAQANERRRFRNALSDQEWEAADPKKIVFGKVVDRHFVPQWKLDERGELNDRDRRKAIERRRIARKRREREREIQRRKELDRRATEALDLAAEYERTRVQESELRAEAQRLERKRREQLLLSPTAAQFKRYVLDLCRFYRQPLSLDTLMRLTGNTDQEFVNACLTEMVRAGQLKDLGKAA